VLWEKKERAPGKKRKREEGAVVLLPLSLVKHRRGNSGGGNSSPLFFLFGEKKKGKKEGGRKGEADFLNQARAQKPSPYAKKRRDAKFGDISLRDVGRNGTAGGKGRDRRSPFLRVRGERKKGKAY